MADIQLKQYVYFAASSEVLSHQDIEALIGIKADRVIFWGERQHEIEKSFPITNVWQIICDKNMCIDDQIAQVIERLKPVHDNLITLSNNEAVDMFLQVVRYFDDEDGQKEIIDTSDGLTKLAGQHQLLGWHLDLEILEFLASIKADIDVDEYN